MSSVPRHVSTAAGAYAVFGGLVSFAGWVLGIYRLTDWYGSGISIKANAAIATMAAGGALLVAVRRPSARRVIQGLGLLSATLGGLTLLEHLTGWNLGIDTLLFDEPPGMAGTAAPGRMGPPASSSFLALGTALILLTGSPRARAIGVGLSIAVLALASLSLTGYWYGAEAMYAAPRVTGIAMQTATILLALSIGVIAANPDRQPLSTLLEDSTAGILARRLFPLILVVPLGIGWLRNEGQRNGLYDWAFGSAIRSVLEVAVLAGLLWWTLRTVRMHDFRQRRAERELRKSEEALKDADRRKDEFIATLAHELRNPLAPIRNAAAMLASRGSIDPTLRWGAEVITRQIRHMVRLLEDLLDVSRISRNRLELRKEWLELGSVIQSAVEASRPLIDGAAHELTVGLPAEPVYVDGDPVRLAQVFSNLLNNAAKYTERGGRIHLSAVCEDAEVVVRVKDNGIGIDREMLPRVFEMFAQAKAALPHAQGGLGIGLALARGVIELHGGRIEAHSAGPGAGSEFVVRLPRLTNMGEAALPAKKMPANATARRVLVVDDLKDSADSLARLLQTWGHQVLTVYGGEAAIEAAASFRPEAIFLDVGMPGVNGFEVCRRIRQTSWGARILIVAVSGWGQSEDRRRTREAGVDHHLIKPADAAEISELLASIPVAGARSVGSQSAGLQ